MSTVDSCLSEKICADVSFMTECERKNHDFLSFNYIMAEFYSGASAIWKAC